MWTTLQVPDNSHVHWFRGVSEFSYDHRYELSGVDKVCLKAAVIFGKCQQKSETHHWWNIPQMFATFENFLSSDKEEMQGTDFSDLVTMLSSQKCFGAQRSCCFINEKAFQTMTQCNHFTFTYFHNFVKP